MTQKQSIDYQELSAELEQIMLELTREDLDIDVALKHYERGLHLIKELETYLETAENKVHELKAKFTSE